MSKASELYIEFRLKYLPRASSFPAARKRQSKKERENTASEAAMLMCICAHGIEFSILIGQILFSCNPLQNYIDKTKNKKTYLVNCEIFF